MRQGCFRQLEAVVGTVAYCRSNLLCTLNLVVRCPVLHEKYLWHVPEN